MTANLISGTFLRSEVPDFLRSSDFYLSLDDAEDDFITIPSECARFSLELNTIDFEENLRCLLTTFRFWGVNHLLSISEFTMFVLTCPEKRIIRSILAQFETELKDLSILSGMLDANSDNEVMCAAMRLGKLELVKVLARNNYAFSRASLIAAAENRHLVCIEFALSNGGIWCADITNLAAKLGDLQMLQFAHEGGYWWRERNVCEDAASGGNLACLQYALEIKGHVWPNKACPGHNIAIIEYARSLGAPWTENTCCDAALKGGVDVLQYLFDQGCPMYSGALPVAAFAGNTDCVRYLRSMGAEWTGFECELAAYGGHLDTLTYLIQCGCPCNALTSWLCAIHDRVDCLRYLHEDGCPWDCTTPIDCTHQWADPSRACPHCEKDSVLLHATKFDGYYQAYSTLHVQLPILNLQVIYACFNHTCSFGITTLCAFYKAPQCLQYAYEHGCAWPANPFLLRNAEHETLRHCLYALCQSWSAETTANAAECKTAVHLQFLHENGCPWDKRTVTNALKSALLSTPIDAKLTSKRPSDFLCLRYAVQHNCPYEMGEVRTLFAQKESYRKSKALREIFPWIEVWEKEEEQRVSRKRLLFRTSAMLTLGVAQVCVQNVVAYLSQK